MAEASHGPPPATLQSAALTAISNDAPVYDAYRPLDVARREIRLLDIGPGLQCSLRHVELDSHPEFYALSYYWGAPGQTRPMTVNGRVVQLRVTLHRFFEVLLHHYGRLTVWVDVLCINQRDRVEQSHQVVMMGEIYQAAMSVYAWLGESDADSDAAMDCIGSVSKVTNAAAAHQYLRQLLTRPYFTRAWIIQECVLNKYLWLFCGSRLANWTSIVRTFFQLESKERSHSHMIRPDLNAHTELFIWKSIAWLRGEDYQLSTSKRRHLLLDTILRFKGTRCADPHDKIYAFLSMAPDGCKVRVDYTKPAIDAVFQVFQDLRPTQINFIDHARELLAATSLTEAQVLSGLGPQPGDSLILYSDQVRKLREDFSPLYSDHSPELQEQNPISPGISFTLFPWPKTEGREFSFAWHYTSQSIADLRLVAHYATEPPASDYVLIRHTPDGTDIDELARSWETVSNTNGQSYPTKLKTLTHLLIGRVGLCQQSL